jgi:hypothetical protein
MGRTITPKYVLEMGGFTNHATTPSAWKGRIPTVAELQRLVMAEVVSTMPGFINETIGLTYGIQIPSFARIRENVPGGRVMVEWKAAMFTVLPDAADYPEVETMANFWFTTRQYLENTMGVEAGEREWNRRQSAYALKCAEQITKNAVADSNRRQGVA